ncbi:MAG: acyltransferase [Myxococcales bacterium]
MSATPVSLLSSMPDLAGLARRRSWVDAVRGLGILLVVVGHVLRGLMASHLLPEAPPWTFLDRFIYAFHMPLFFFVAGLFLMPASDERYADFAHRRLVRLGYPYLVWASLQTLSQIMLSRYTNHPVGVADFLKLGFHPQMQFWFLYALFLQALFLGLLAKLGLGRGGILTVCAIVFASMHVLPSGHWYPLNQARTYLIYTAIGVYLGAPDRIVTPEERHPVVYLGAAGLGYVLVALAVWEQPIPAQDSLGVFLVAAVGSLASICLCAFLAGCRGQAAQGVTLTLKSWGEASLAIFVAHTLASAATRIGLEKALHTRSIAVHLGLGTLVGLGLPWGLYALTRRYHIPYVFEWPSARKQARPSLVEESNLPGSPAH